MKISEIYSKRKEEADKKIQEIEHLSAKISYLRFFVFIIAVILLAIAFFVKSFPYYYIVLPSIFFVLLVFFHDRILRKQQYAFWKRDYWQGGLDRLNGKWLGKGILGEKYYSEDHLYANDLDLFGEGSLFELMCTARTSSGEQQLASWLSTSDSYEAILERQEAVKEIIEQIDLREQIYLSAKQMSSLVEPKPLIQWGKLSQQYDSSTRLRLRILYYFQGALGVLALLSVFFWDYGLALLVAVAIFDWLISRTLKKKIEQIINGVEGAKRQLGVLSDVLVNFEKMNVKSSLLQRLKKDLGQEKSFASDQISKLGKMVDMLEQSSNQLFAPFAFLLMWEGHFALSLEKWRLEHSADIEKWFNALGQAEALFSISGFAYEHPGYVFPEIVEKGPVYKGDSLGHPLLELDGGVRNSIDLSHKTQSWIVSGSNMSGKSTFLRVVGINAALAMAGAPVCAQSLKMSPVFIGSTIRILDSLHKGKSRFYAEISTLKDIVSLSEGKFPLLFLLDEIFHGTNSHDRRIGAHAVINTLLEKGAIGLVTTHDLALTKTENEYFNKVKNVHFEDSVKDGTLYFDYLLKEGPVTKSNALELMRMVGLQV